MNLAYAVIPILGVLAFAYFWNRSQAWLNATYPDWKNKPTFYSLGLVLGITLFATQTLGAFLLDPLAMDKIEVGILSAAFDSSQACRDAGRSPVLSLSCEADYLGGNYTGVGRIPFGENPECKCAWETTPKNNDSLINDEED